MGRSSQRHGREIYNKDTSNQINLPGGGSVGYGGGVVAAVEDDISGAPSAWGPPANFAVVYKDATTSTMSWDVPSDPGDGTLVFGYLFYRDGVQVLKGNLISPQDDNQPGLEAGKTYTYTALTWDSAGRISSTTSFEYTHSP